MHGVQRAPERPMHAALCRVDREYQQIGSCLRRSMLRQCNRHRQRHKQNRR